MENARLRLRVERAVPPTIHVTGELDSENCGKLGSIIRETLHDKCTRVDLRLERLDFVDSSGLRTLVSGALGARKMGGSLGILSLSPQLDHLLNVSGLRSLFDIAETSFPARTPVKPRGSGDSELRFSVPAELKSCRDARNGVCDFAAEMGLGVVAIDDLRLAMGEAFSNATRHGDCGSNTIEIQCRLDEKRLLVSLTYQSDPFDPDCVPAPDPDYPAEGGMGIHFMKLVMDDVQYDFTDGYATVTMEKALTTCI